MFEISHKKKVLSQHVLNKNFFEIYLFIWLWWVFIAAQRLSLVARLLLVAVCRLLIAVASLVVEHGL